MPRSTIAKRVEILERKTMNLDDLPARVGGLESQILQLRDETRGEFAAFRTEMRAEFAAVRQKMRAMAQRLRVEIRSGDEETRTYMRVLHEDVIARIAALAEGRR